VASTVGALGPKDDIITALGADHGRREERADQERQEHPCCQPSQTQVGQCLHRVVFHRAAVGDTLARKKEYPHDLEAL
jgi:hypothetical protein